MSAPTLTHLDARGAARMVDVGGKGVTQRRALAGATLRLSPEALAALRAGGPKGDALQVARIAGIQGAKRTADLIPLCHPLALDGVRLDLALHDSPPSVAIEAEVRCTGRTGVEMEALTAVSVAALTVYDMVKAVDRFVTIEQIALLEKEGGRSGHVVRPAAPDSGNPPAEPGSQPIESGGSAAHSED